MMRASSYGITSGRLSLLPAAILVVIALHTLVPAVEASACTEPKAIPFTSLSPGKGITADKGPEGDGLRTLFISAQGRFGAAMVPSTDLPKEFKETHYSRMDAATVATLLTDSGRLYWLVVLCLILTAVFPVVGAIVLLLRCLCGRCGGNIKPSDEPQTPKDVARRTKCSLAFWNPVVLMTLMSLGALDTLDHASVAMDRTSKQARFISSTLPSVLEKPIDDIAVVAITNMDEFMKALRSRANACANDAVAAVDDILKKDALLKFVGTASQSLAKINQLIAKVESAAGSKALNGVRRHAGEASTSLEAAEKGCTGCPADMVQRLKQMKQGLDTFVTASEINVPQDVKQLKAKIQQADVSGQLAQIPTKERIKADVDKNIKELEKKINELRDNLKGKIEKLNESVQIEAANAKTSLASLVTPPADVKSQVSNYELVLIGVCVVTTAVTGLYIFGNQCLMWRAPTGLFSLTTASWVLSISALVFLCFFPAFMPAATLSMGVSTAVDRHVCVPAKDIGSPGSRSLAEFLSLQFSEEGGGNAPKRLKAARALPLSHHVVTGQHNDGSSFELRHPAAAYSNRAGRKHASVSATKGPRSRTKRTGILRSAARRAKTLQRGRRYGHGRQQSDSGEDISDFTAVLKKRLTPDMLYGIMQRFSSCPKGHLSLFKLLGKDVMTDLARKLMGEDSPWLGLVDDTAREPKFDALEKFGSLGKIPPLGPDIKTKLSTFLTPPTSQDMFKKMADAAKAAKQGFSVIGTTKSGLEQLNTQGAPATGDVKTAVSRLAEALKLKGAYDSDMGAITKASDDFGKATTLEGKSLDAYLKDLVDRWDALASQRDGGTDKIQETTKKVREHVGDCQPFYVLYITTVNTACDEALRPFAAFWFCVWCFQVIGIPVFAGALLLSTYYARSAAKEVKEGDITVERKTIILSGPADRAPQAWKDSNAK